MKNVSDTRLDNAISASFMSAIPDPLIRELTRGAICLDVPAGGSIYHEDEEPRWGIIANGLIRVYMTSPTGRQVTVRYARAGDVLGVAVVAGGPAPVSVQMLTQSTIYFFNTALLKDMAQTHPRIGWLLAEELTERLYETLEALAEETFSTLRQRVARHLLDLAATQQRGQELVARVSQQDLADAVGSVRPAVARVVGELRVDGLVQTIAGGIAIVEPARLYEETWRRGL